MKFDRRQLLADLQPFLVMSKEGFLSEHYAGIQMSPTGWTSVNQFGHLWMSAGPDSGDLEVRFDVEPLCRLLGASSAGEVNLKESSGKLVFSTPGHSAKLPLYPQSDWPRSECEYNVCTAPLVESILGSIGASDEKQVSRAGVQVRDGWAMTTDSIHLRAHRTAYEGHLRIPLPVAKMLKFFNPHSRVEVSSTHIRIVDPSYVYTAQLAHEPCLNWLPLLKPREHTVCLNKADCLDALKRSAILDQGYVDIQTSEGELIITVPDKSRVVIECQGEIKEPIRLNPTYLREAVSSLPNPKFVIEFTDPTKPLVIQEGDLLHMLMPMARVGR